MIPGLIKQCEMFYIVYCFLTYLTFWSLLIRNTCLQRKSFAVCFFSIAMIPFLKAKCSFHTCMSSNRSMCTHSTVAASMRASSQPSSFMKKMSHIELIPGKYWLSYADWLQEGASFLLAWMWVSCSQEAINFVWRCA